METAKQKFNNDSLEAWGLNGIEKMVIAVHLPTGATELIINTDNINEKIEYYLNAYDDDMCLKNNPDVQIVGWMFV